MSQMNHKQFLDRIAGSGGLMGGKSESAESDKNTLRSKAILRFVELISEGPCEGLVNGEKSIFFDQTPLRGKNGKMNFKGVEWEERKGTPDQAPLRGFANVESPFDVSTQVTKNNGPVTRLVNNPDADAVMVIMRIPALVEQKKKDGSLQKTSVKYTIRVRPNGGAWQTVHVEDIKNEKTTGAYQLIHRVKLPHGGNPWSIQVERNTDDSTNERLANETWWDSYTVRTEGQFIYPNSAMVAFEVEARQVGQSMPQRFYRFRGIKCRVPSNYNPETHTYDGLWDGEWANSLKWTDNPAWIFLDLLLNDRYGLGQFVDEGIIDKWALYALAQYCDGLVKSGRQDENGDPIMERRYSFNGVIKDRDEAWRVLQSVCASWRGLAYWSLGQIWPVADKPADVEKIITPANVIGGRITYAGTGKKARHSVALVTYNDKNDFSKPAVECVVNDAALLEFGWREKQVQIAGCDSRTLAHRHGNWILDTEYYSTETASFTVSYQHADIKPGDIVAIADPRKANVRLGGRIKMASLNYLILDAPFDRLAGHNYEIMVAMPDGTVETRAVASWEQEVIEDGESKGFQRANLASNLPEVPMIHADWIIVKGDVVPRQYRVLVMKESAPNKFDVTALFHDPTKYDRIERNKNLPPPNYTRDDTAIDPPENLVFREIHYVDRKKNLQTRLNISWQKPSTTLAVKSYTVVLDHPTEGSQTYGPFPSTFLEVDAVDGEYGVQVFANSHFGIESEPLIGTVVVDTSGAMPLPEVTDLELAEDPTTTVYDDKGIEIQWKNMLVTSSDATSDDSTAIEDYTALYDYTEIKVKHTASGDLLRKATRKGSHFRYTFRTNKRDNAKKGRNSAQRGITFVVTTYDKLGRASEPVSLAVTNPAPAAPSFTITQRGTTMQLEIDEDTSADDIEGYIVWASTNPGFTPNGVNRGDGNVVYVGNSRTPIIDVQRKKTYYVVVAAYDAFGRTTLNRSPQVATVTGGTTGTDGVPAKPTGLVATSRADRDNQGHIRSMVIFNWADNTEATLDKYEIEVDEDGDDYNTYTRQKSRLQFRGQANSVYRGRVRACDDIGNKSEWTNWETVTAAKKVSKPNKPTNIKKKNGNRRSRHKWDKSPDPDHKRTAVWVKSVNVPPNPATDVPTDYAAGTHYDVDIDPGDQKYVFFAHQDTSDTFSDVVDGDGLVVSEPLTEEDVDLTDLRQEIDDKVKVVTDQVSTDLQTMQTDFETAISTINADIEDVTNDFNAFMNTAPSVELVGDTIERLRDLTDEVRKAATHSLFEGALAYTERKEIIAQQDDDRAAFTDEIKVLVAADAALATRTTTLEAQTGTNTSAISTLTTTMTTADAALASQITTMNTTLGTKASASAVTAIDTRLTTAEGTISGHTTSITNLNTTVAGKASASALSALDTRVTAAEGTITSTSTALTNLTTTVGTKASASALSALDTRVTTAEGTISSHTSSITSLNTTVAGKASSTALNTLTTTVTEIDGNVNAVATALTDLFAGDIAGNQASVRVRMAAQAAPGGYNARYGIQVRAGSGNSFGNAGFFMDVTTGGASRVVIEANKFYVTDGSSNVVPFAVSGGAVYMQNAYMAAGYITGQLTASQISVGSLSALSATLGAVDISSANIGSLTVGTLNIAGNAVTSSVAYENPSSIYVNAASYFEIASVYLNWGSVAPQNFRIDYQFKSMENQEYNVMFRFNGSQVGNLVRFRSPVEAMSVAFELLSGFGGSAGTFSIAINRIATGANTEIRLAKISVTAQKR